MRFLTDVENDYFIRIEDPGELKLGLLKYSNNEMMEGMVLLIRKKLKMFSML